MEMHITPDEFLDAYLAIFARTSRMRNTKDQKELESFVMDIESDESEEDIRILKDIIQSINLPKELEAQGKSMRQYKLTINSIKETFEVRRLKLCLNNRPRDAKAILDISRFVYILEEKKRSWNIRKIAKKKTRKK
jgi:hypothetical protein